MNVKSIVALLMKEKPTENDRGNAIHRSWFSSERYVVDFANDFKEEGWEQYDTDQDAHYFGVWVNRTKFMTLTYAEGDWTLVVCPDAAHYNSEIEDANRFYGEGYIAKSLDLDKSQITVYRQDRSKFLISPQGGI